MSNEDRRELTTKDTKAPRSTKIGVKTGNHVLKRRVLRSRLMTGEILGFPTRHYLSQNLIDKNEVENEN